MKEFHLDKQFKITPGFKTPQGYFEKNATNIFGQFSESRAKEIPLYARRKTWIYAVAAIFVLTLMVPMVTVFRASNTEIDNTAIENYLAVHASEDELAEFLDPEDIQKIQIDSGIEDKAIEDLLSTNSNLEEYIIN